MNDARSSRLGLPLDIARGDNASLLPTVVATLEAPPVPVVLLPLDGEAAGTPPFPADHPPWQRDVVSISSRARALLAHAVPIVVRALSYWDHRVREIVFGARTLSVDPAGCYRLH